MISFHFCSIHQLLKFFNSFIESILICSKPTLRTFQSFPFLQQDSALFAELFSLQRSPIFAQLCMFVALSEEV